MDNSVTQEIGADKLIYKLFVQYPECRIISTRVLGRRIIDIIGKEYVIEKSIPSEWTNEEKENVPVRLLPETSTHYCISKSAERYAYDALCKWALNKVRKRR
ncbi:MAG: hypothetical protein LBM62_01530 [Mediterranea sp.]|jgi:hypothetical protein|nr:hypothetical protein [Mediterranea sp.]